MKGMVDMTQTIISTYTEYDENGTLRSKTVTESPYLSSTEDRYEPSQTTPMGLAGAALLQTGLIETAKDPRVAGFWELFRLGLERNGYEIKERALQRDTSSPHFTMPTDAFPYQITCASND